MRKLIIIIIITSFILCEGSSEANMVVVLDEEMTRCLLFVYIYCMCRLKRPAATSTTTTTLALLYIRYARFACRRTCSVNLINESLPSSSSFLVARIKSVTSFLFYFFANRFWYQHHHHHRWCYYPSILIVYIWLSCFNGNLLYLS